MIRNQKNHFIHSRLEQKVHIHPFVFFTIFLFLVSCVETDSETSSNEISPGSSQGTLVEGETRAFDPVIPNSVVRLDETFLDQYFSNRGLCKIRLKDCPGEHVFVSQSSDDYQDYDFDFLSQSECVEKGREFHQQCDDDEPVVANFYSPPDFLVSSTSFVSQDRLSPSSHNCQIDLQKCVIGASAIKFDLFEPSREIALNSCLEMASQRIEGCSGGLLKKIELTSNRGFQMVHLNHDVVNIPEIGNCNALNNSKRAIIDFNKRDLGSSSMVGMQLGYDYRNATTRRADSETTNFNTLFRSDLGPRLYRTWIEDFYLTTRVSQSYTNRGAILMALLGGTPKYYIPKATDKGTNLPAPYDHLDEYELDATEKGYLIDGQVGTGGGVKAHLELLKDRTYYPAVSQMILEPWDAPDFFEQDGLIESLFCNAIDGLNCFFTYGNESNVPWKNPGGGEVTFSNATVSETKDVRYSGYETYVQVIQAVEEDSYFRSVNFAGPSFYSFDKNHLIEFLEYCLGRRAMIKSTTPSLRGCEVNYLTWHASDHYENNLGQLGRDIEWVRRNIIENSKYDELAIRGIIITNVQGKRDFYVPTSLFRHLDLLEKSQVEFASRGCWFRTCDSENSMGGLLNFDSSGTDIESYHKKTTMWWATEWYNRTRANRVVSYNLDDKFVLRTVLNDSLQGTQIVLGMDEKQNVEKSVRLILRGLSQVSGFSTEKTNIRFQMRNLATENFDRQTSTDARNNHFSKIRMIAPEVSDSDMSSMQTVLELPITSDEVEVCLPAIKDGDLYNYKIDFTPID